MNCGGCWQGITSLWPLILLWLSGHNELWWTPAVDIYIFCYLFLTTFLLFYFFSLFSFYPPTFLLFPFSPFFLFSFFSLFPFFLFLPFFPFSPFFSFSPSTFLLFLRLPFFTFSPFPPSPAWHSCVLLYLLLFSDFCFYISWILFMNI